MDDEVGRGEPAFPVVCVWCGAEIRKASAPESPGMCQACFRHMVEEHTRLAARQRHARAYASDR
jgi:NMD protein affecting ribosome stability and mRNA decay